MFRAGSWKQKWGDNTFCPGMRGHEVLTWNLQVQKNFICVWGGHEIYLKDWEMGGTGSIPGKKIVLHAQNT